jgi:hypothetical protein
MDIKLIAKLLLVKTQAQRLYEKSSQADQPPQHEANHRSIYQRFAART